MDGALLKLRGYSTDDLDALFELDKVCFSAPFRFSRTTMRRFAEAPTAHTIVAEVDGKLGGFTIVHVELVHRQRVAYLVTLDVDPAFRRRGIAHALVSDAQKYATSQKCSAMLLHVFVDNDAAVKFYKSEGFQRLNVEDDFYGSGLHAFLYRKSLP